MGPSCMQVIYRAMRGRGSPVVKGGDVEPDVSIQRLPREKKMNTPDECRKGG